MERPQLARSKHDSCPEQQLANLFPMNNSLSAGAGPLFPFPWTKLPLLSMNKIFSSSSWTKLLPSPSFNKTPLQTLPLFFQIVTPCSDCSVGDGFSGDGVGRSRRRPQLSFMPNRRMFFSFFQFLLSSCSRTISHLIWKSRTQSYTKAEALVRPLESPWENTWLQKLQRFI